MSLTERVARLRRQSLEAVPELSPERALLMTEFYAALRDAPPAPVERALAFKHLMERKTICINAGELIVGERGPGPKQTPTIRSSAATAWRTWRRWTGARKSPSR